MTTTLKTSHRDVSSHATRTDDATPSQTPQAPQGITLPQTPQPRSHDVSVKGGIKGGVSVKGDVKRGFEGDVNVKGDVDFEGDDGDELPPRNQDIDILARTIWGEARGESVKGMEAVAMVIMNRFVRAARWTLKGKKIWWGGTIREICLKPYQFSCWNTNDPNRQKLNSVDEQDQAFVICKRVARRAVNGALQDQLEGATHYHSKGITPYWSLGKAPCCEIGNHIFYNNIA